MNRLVNPTKALRTLRKTPLLLRTLLAGVSQEEAMARRDGPEGWSVLWIVCHLRDTEELFTERAQTLLAGPPAVFAVVPNEEMIARGHYEQQELRAMLAEYEARRQAFIALLESLSDEQWLLDGTHPVQGPATLLDVAVNTGLHDIDHLEQIARCLNNQ